MIKEKPKRDSQRTSRFVKPLGIILALVAFLFSAWLIVELLGLTTQPGYFARFVTEDEIETFLTDNLEIGVSTREEVIDFLDGLVAIDKQPAEMLSAGNCDTRRPIIECESLIFDSMRQGGRAEYRIKIGFDVRGRLSGISVIYLCNCSPD